MAFAFDVPSQRRQYAPFSSFRARSPGGVRPRRRCPGRRAVAGAAHHGDGGRRGLPAGDAPGDPFSLGESVHRGRGGQAPAERSAQQDVAGDRDPVHRSLGRQPRRGDRGPQLGPRRLRSGRDRRREGRSPVPRPADRRLRRRRRGPLPLDLRPRRPPLLGRRGAPGRGAAGRGAAAPLLSRADQGGAPARGPLHAQRRRATRCRPSRAPGWRGRSPTPRSMRAPPRRWPTPATRARPTACAPRSIAPRRCRSRRRRWRR